MVAMIVIFLQVRVRDQALTAVAQTLYDQTVIHERGIEREVQYRRQPRDW